ncbi:MAG: isochorismatase family cysteine hydrolase [Sporolactobacillus sp.]
MELNSGTRAHVAMLIIDMMNALEFERGLQLLAGMQAITPRIKHLRAAVHAAGGAVIYVNDNAGRWQSRQEMLINRALAGPATGCARELLPGAADYFIIKPKHSGFFATPLQALLTNLQTGTLILTGVAGNICVLFTAADAYMRDYRLIMPCDCCASNAGEDNRYALEMAHNVLEADTRSSAQIIADL